MTNEETRPACVPEGARWTYATDGLGRRVPIWVQLDTVQIFDPGAPDTPFGWWEAGDHFFSHTEHAILNPSTAAQCRALWVKLRDGIDEGEWAKIGATVFGSVSEMVRLEEETDEEFRERIQAAYGLGDPEVVTRDRYDRARRRLMRKWLELQSLEYVRQAEVESFYGEAEKEEKKHRWSRWCDDVARKLEER